MANLEIDERCWKCNSRITDHFQMNSAEMFSITPPIPGDLTICGACGAFSEFDGLLHLQKPGLEKMRAIVNTPALMDMQARLVKREGN